jgi:hypothetical protein
MKQKSLILYNDFMKYMLKKANINIKVKLLVGIKAKKYFGYVDLKQLDKGNQTIRIEDASLKIVLKRIAHEITHIIQYKKGDLNYKDDQITWKGKSIISIKDYNNAAHDTHNNLPFEKEAIESKKSVDQYITKELNKFKGSSPTMDFIIEYI